MTAALHTHMSVRVTADIFSGRPNPEWTLNESQIAQLANQLRDAFAAPPLRAHIPDGLGYRGLIIASDDPRLPPSETNEGWSDFRLSSF